MTISESTRYWLGRAESAIGSLVIAFAVIGLTLLPLTTPLYVGALVRAVGSAELTGLSQERTLEMAEAVRGFVTSSDASALPAEVDGREAFDASAVSHLEDVRDVMVPSRSIALGLGAVGLLWVVLRRRSERARFHVAYGVFASGVILLAAAGALLLAGIASFDGLFAWFHGLFFAEGTWVFPADALLIQVFPLPFWIAAGATWGALVIAEAVGLVWAGRRLMFTKRGVGV